MARIAVFSKYFGYDVGGAERSVIELMKSLERSGNQIVAVVPENVSGFGAKSHRLPLPSTWEVRKISLRCCLTRFRFIDYFLNKPEIERAATLIRDASVLYAYGMLAPAMINSYHGETVYLVRDEYGLGWNVNYYKGVRRFIQEIYHASEAPLRKIWKNELRRAIARSRLIANSKFIAEELRKISPNATIDIVYPQIDENALQKDYEYAFAKYQGPRGVVAVGDNVLKGGDIVRRIARLIPDVPFFVFDRRYKKPVRKKNITYMPWCSPGTVYAYARMIIVPSRWAEAFSRVIFEAQKLGIPVLASDRGGIPEVISDPSNLIIDIEDVSEWATRINKILKSNSLKLCAKD